MYLKDKLKKEIRNTRRKGRITKENTNAGKKKERR
jgi:hypothetical protein